MICRNCGTISSGRVRFCPACGALLDSTSSAQQGRPPISPYAAPPSMASAPSLTAAQGALLGGRYQVIGMLGQGAFGRVYLAQDTQAPGSAPLAVKELLLDDRVASPDEREERITWFRREIGTLLNLAHPGIPRIDSFWTAPTGELYLTMEYVPGKTLQQIAREADGPIPWPQVVSWGIELCNVLAYLHSRYPPIIFRDMKPPNVIIDDRTRQPVLIDFGIARQVAQPGGTMIGTPGYAPYEQWNGAPEPRSDVYALGAMLHSLLTGRNPEAEFTRLMNAQHLDVPKTMQALFPPAGSLVAGIPMVLSQVIAKATAFEPHARYPTATAMAAALQHVAQTNSVAHVMAPTFSQPARPRGSAARTIGRLLLAIAIVAGGLLAGGVAGLLLMQSTPRTALPSQAAGVVPYSYVSAARVYRPAHSLAGMLANGDPLVLSLGTRGFPAGAVLTHRHVDVMPAAIRAESIFGVPNTQGQRYDRLQIRGALFESVRLPRLDGAARELAVLSSVFPSFAAANAALRQDAALRGCRASPLVALPVRARTCAFQDRRAPLSGMYVFATSGNVEVVVIGEVLSATPPALRRAIRDASYAAQNMASHLTHVLALAHGCLSPARWRAFCRSAPPATAITMTVRPVVRSRAPSAHLSRVTVALLDMHGRTISMVRAGHAVRMRIRWTVAGLIGAARESVIWRVTRDGRRLIDDRVGDAATSGASYRDDVLTVDGTWAVQGRYTLAGIVTVANNTAQAHMMFAVGR